VEWAVYLPKVKRRNLDKPPLGPRVLEEQRAVAAIADLNGAHAEESSDLFDGGF